MPARRPAADGPADPRGAEAPGSGRPGTGLPADDVAGAERDLAEVPAVEVVTTLAVHLMSAAAIRCGLGEGPMAEQERDLDEARTLINALAGLVVASAPDLGGMHAGPLRDGVRSLQLAFREASAFPDPPGEGPGERWTGPVG